MPISYRDAGVDIDAGEELVRRIAPLARATRTANVVTDVGGFAGMCALPAGLTDPLLVSGTDGVGTKLKIAFATGVHDTVGIDLVAMCVNDIITCGATPLFFLDYFATGALDVEVGEAVVRGVAEGCRLAGCALLGGETAEMPGMYTAGEYDLAGFAVGVVERAAVLGADRVRAGDVLIGLPSSGLHSNGFSLARRVLLQAADALTTTPKPLTRTLGAELLTPTRIYTPDVARLREAGGLHALVHITGGGLVDNLPRVLPDDLAVAIDAASWMPPPIFRLIAERGPVAEDELRRTFNLGVGMVAMVAPEAAEAALAACPDGWRLGRVIARDQTPVVWS